MKRVGVLCGGSGSSKFARSFSSFLGAQFELGFIANVSDNFWFRGLYVCPDIDILTYALAGKLDVTKGWGLSGDSFGARESLSIYDKKPDWFSLGDKDVALSIRRTQLLSRGWRLSAITSHLSETLGVRNKVIPSTDSPVETFVRTQLGMLHLQEFWVKNRASLRVSGIEYLGIEKATPNQEYLEYVRSCCVLCPANPITSIMPSVSIPGVMEILKESKVVAITPFVGKDPFSGPAGILMNGLGLEASSFGVAQLYSDFLDIMVLDVNEDKAITGKIRDAGIECVSTNTRISNKDDELSISREISTLI